MKRKFPKVLFFLLWATFAFAQGSHSAGKVNWSVNPYEQKEFIRNDGQYDTLTFGGDAKILYGVRNLGTEIYFSPKGLFYLFKTREVIRDEEEKREGPGAEDHDLGRIVYHYFPLSMTWENSNPDVQLVAEDKTSDYHCFSNPKNPKGPGINFVPAFKKITYKNLYPNIDVVYTFHPEEGIKYALVLHPGADVSAVKMNYSGASSIFLDAAKNIHLNIPAIGDVIDHAPQTYYADDRSAIGSSFVLAGNEVFFHVDNYSNTREIVIDPWTVNPGFSTVNKAYDVMKDGGGNILVFGGGTPYVLKKYNNSGTLIWSYTSPFNGWYGDLAVHPNGESYISEGYSSSNAFGSLAKVTVAGTQVWYTTWNQLEFWGLAFNCTYTTLTTAGGVWQARTSTVNTGTGAVTGTVTFVNTGETRAMTQAPTGNFYHLCISGANSIAALTSANALIWNTASGFTNGYGTPQYFTSFSTQDAGYNGIACNANFVYSIDGVTVNKKNITTGATITTAPIPGGSQTLNGGVYLDACGNVYVGSQTQIHKYDPNLALLSSTPAPGSVYCLTEGVGAGDIIASGNGFVASINIAGLCPINLTLAPSSTSGCSSTGSATVAVSGGSGNYTYFWTPGNQTTQTITGLTSGTYTVVVTDASSCIPYSATVLVTTGSGNIQPNPSVISNPNCSACNGSVTVNPSGGSTPYTYAWNNAQTTQTATGLCSGTYTVTVTDNGGCSQTATVSITASGAVSVTAAPTNILCSGQCTGSAMATPSGGTSPYTYSWNNAQTGQNATGLCAGTYTVTITDANSCSATVAVTITQPAAITSATSSTPAACGNNNGTATVNASGGVSPYSYSWNNAQTTSTATGLAAGTYTVTITDANGCTQTATVSVTANGAVSVTAAATNVLCNGQCTGSISATPSGGTSPYTYAWNNAQTSQNATGLCAGTYTVTLTDVNGCTSTATTTVTQPSAVSLNTSMTPSNCQAANGTATVNASGGTSPYTYLWNNGQTTQTATGLAQNNYTVTVTDANGCTQAAIVAVGNNGGISLTASSTSATCSSCIGTATAAPSGGTTPFTYSWTSNPVQTTATASGLCSGNYTVTITDNNGCTATASANVGLTGAFASANFSMTPAQTSILEPTICFTNNSANATSFTWHFGDPNNSTSNAQNPNCFTYSDTGTYCVTLFANNSFNCPDSITYCLRIEPDVAIYVPNAFTPNGDNWNNTFYANGVGIDPNNFEMWIFDRWGNLIWHTNKWLDGWDGRANGGKDIAQIDVYVWKIICRDVNGGKHSIIGHVSLIK